MKKLLILLLCICLYGCSYEEKEPVRKLNKEVTLSLFYIDTCSECKEFKQKAIPYLQEQFGESLNVQLYNLDDEGIEDIYDPIIDRLEYFDEEYYGMGPFIVVEDYFALLGYTSGDETYLADDIENAVLNKELSLELSNRMEYKK